MKVTKLGISKRRGEVYVVRPGGKVIGTVRGKAAAGRAREARRPG